MTVCSSDIKDMLEADSQLGLVYKDNLFIGSEPSTPKNCVTIYDTPGFPLDLSLDQKSLERPSIQIRIRNTNYLTGMALAEKIVISLHGRAQETWNGTLYSVIICSSGPALLDWVDNNARIVLNLNMIRR